jgi:hypothetical protein
MTVEVKIRRHESFFKAERGGERQRILRPEG